MIRTYLVRTVHDENGLVRRFWLEYLKILSSTPILAGFINPVTSYKLASSTIGSSTKSILDLPRHWFFCSRVKVLQRSPGHLEGIRPISQSRAALQLDVVIRSESWLTLTLSSSCTSHKASVEKRSRLSGRLDMSCRCRNDQAQYPYYLGSSRGWLEQSEAKYHPMI